MLDSEWILRNVRGSRQRNTNSRIARENDHHISTRNLAGSCWRPPLADRGELTLKTC